MSNPFLGRWDLVVDTEGDAFPSWLEVSEEGGRFVGRFGSARPVPSVKVRGNAITFTLPKQYEGRTTDLEFTGVLDGNALSGTTLLDNGAHGKWRAVRAPELPYRDVTFHAPVELVAHALDDWHPRSPDADNNWSVIDGMLVNTAAGSDLITNEQYFDFRLVAEYRYPEKSNSGIYLRGRYEFQILDDYAETDAPHNVGNSAAIYGFLAPTVNAIKPANEWNTAEITLIGRHITVVLNGVTVIARQEIPGITGGALDSSEDEPGPIFVQGDHGPVTFRRLTLYPASYE